MPPCWGCVSLGVKSFFPRVTTPCKTHGKIGNAVKINAETNGNCPNFSKLYKTYAFYQRICTAYGFLDHSLLAQHSVEVSVARHGCPWENGYAERLIGTLKGEEVYLNDYENIRETRDRIGHFITQVYHQKRPHSALGCLTPMEFEQQNLDLTFLIFGLNKRWHFIFSE